MKALWNVFYFVLRVLARLVVLALFEKWVPLDRSLLGRGALAEKPGAPGAPKAKTRARLPRPAPLRESASAEDYDIRFSREGDSIPVSLSGEFPPRRHAPRAKPANTRRRHPLLQEPGALRDALTLSAALGARPRAGRR